MKKFSKILLLILSWITVPLLIYYFKWAAQAATSLPGLPPPGTDSILEIISDSTDVIIVSLLGSIPIFYLSFFLTPKLLFKGSYINISLYTAGIIAYYFVVILITYLVFPMYYYFGTPYAVKVLPPIVLLSALGGTLLKKLQGSEQH